MQDCVFCKIVNREIEAKYLYEEDQFIVIKDKSPKTSIHYLFITKKHIKNLASMEKEDFEIASKMFSLSKDISKWENIKDFKLLTNNGKLAGQEIFHFHMHFLAGQNLEDI